MRGARAKRQSAGTPRPAVRDRAPLPAGPGAEGPNRGRGRVGRPGPGPGRGRRSGALHRGRGMGPTHPEQWGKRGSGRPTSSTSSPMSRPCSVSPGSPERFSFAPGRPSRPPPGADGRDPRTASEPVGLIGALHPNVRGGARGCRPRYSLFEIALAALSTVRLPGYVPVSRYPSVRRDLAVIVDDGVAVDRILDGVRRGAPATLNDAAVFDLYRGEGIGGGQEECRDRLDLPIRFAHARRHGGRWTHRGHRRRAGSRAGSRVAEVGWR